MFNFKIEGIESIKEDLDNFNKQVNEGITYGLRSLSSELTPCLQRHIQKDVYDAYKPEDYERRHDNPSYGMSLYDKDNMGLKLTAKGIEFTYTPNGKNSHYPDSPYYSNGDAIIDVIQSDHNYLWRKEGNIGVKRPFWNNFVEEVEAQGDKWFVQGFNKYNPELQAKSDGKLVKENGDYQLQPNFNIADDTTGNSSDDDKLPF